tara:strand:- start:1040 stop:1798 length:759 start_codon:yes stop_codon:yes gene_type:complete
MKLTKKQLNEIISESLHQEELNESIFSSVENYLMSAVGGIPMLGDTAALAKAIAADLPRVAKDMSDLGKLLRPFGMDDSFNVLVKSREEVLIVAKNIYNADPNIKKQIREEFYELAESLKTLSISLMAINPEPFTSITSSLVFTSMPVERFLIDGAPVLGELFAKIEKNPIGSVIMKALKGVATAASLGIFGIVFNDPFLFFENLGMIIDATLDEGKYTHLFTGVGDFAKEYIKLTEGRMDITRAQILAGIK